jgi:branched-chain amino acid transport system substrate-binding protein
VRVRDLLRPLRLLAIVAALSFAVVSCGDDDEGGGGGGGDSASSAGETAETPSETKCGAGTGEKASGEAIKIGALVTKIPGIDFTDITDAAGAFFECVNDNGGINGRPVEYIAQEHGTDPQQVPPATCGGRAPRARWSSSRPSSRATRRSTRSRCRTPSRPA